MLLTKTQIAQIRVQLQRINPTLVNEEIFINYRGLSYVILDIGKSKFRADIHHKKIMASTIKLCNTILPT